MKTKIVFILVTVLAIIILVVIYSILRSIKQPSTNNGEPTSPLPTLYQPQITTPPKQPDSLPVTPGQGIDLGEQSVIDSIQEINKIQSSLPYKQTITLSTGAEVDIIISSGSIQETAWILPVSIEGIDYNIPVDNPDYRETRNNFIEAANIVFTWLNSKGVKPENTYISWSHRAAIQDRIEGWLKETNP
jgi:hypothetical protein